MPRAKIVYNGAGGGGDLFAGKKFYLLQRVPSRDKWKDLVTSNGGAVVLAEAQADIIIADHARAHQPVGSISWTFIDQSVKKGELEDIENHRAGPATKVVREVGSKQPARQGRTPFTAEDDRILMEWCTRAERQGVSVRGNKLFQQLEAKNPRHTFQSWRDRWIKQLDHLPRPVLENDEEEEGEGEGEEEEEDPQPVKRKHIPKDIPTRSKFPASSAGPRAAPHAIVQRESGQRASGLRSSVQADSGQREPVRKVSAQSSSVTAESAQRDASRRSPTQRREQVPSSPQVKSSPKRVKSNGNTFTEEETNLLVEMHNDILTVADDQLIDFWITWATEYKEHTAQEWCNHFKEYVVPKMKSKGKTKGKSKEMPPTAAKTAVGESAPKATSSKTTHKEIVEVKDSQEQSSGRTSGSSQAEKLLKLTRLNETVFNEELSRLAERYNFDVDFNPTVCDRSISLFYLWQLVESDEFGGFDRVTKDKLWPKVASRLDLDPNRSHTAPGALRICFEEFLVDLEGVILEDDANESSLIAAQLLETVNHETDLDDLDNEAVDPHAQEQDDDLDSPQHSSPLKPTGSASRKRGSNGSGSSPYNKRQRLDKGKGKEFEIPSTPEDDVNKHQAFRPTHQPSPLKNASFPRGEEQSDEEYSDDDGLFVSTNGQGSAGRRLPEPRILEPETQDFHFPGQEPGRKVGSLSPEFSSSPPPLLAPKHQSQTSTAATRGSVHSTNKEDSSTQSQTDSQKQAQLQEFIDDLVEKGYPQETVLEALEATTLELGPNVERVAESLNLEEGIPNNIKGVWDIWDDRSLKDPVESKEYRHILLKHGPQRIKERKKFLADREMWANENDGADDGEDGE